MTSRVTPLAVGAAGAVWMAAAGLMYRPSGSTALPIGCPFKRLTGLDCPGCGSTRSLGALMHLDLAAALDHNVLVPFALAFVVVSWAVWTRSTWIDRPTPALVRGPGAIMAIGAVLVGFAVVRNLDVGAWLASGLSSS
jgi:Protein of unknown function (DUF2752)